MGKKKMVDYVKTENGVNWREKQDIETNRRKEILGFPLVNRRKLKG